MAANTCVVPHRPAGQLRAVDSPPGPQGPPPGLALPLGRLPARPALPLLLEHAPITDLLPPGGLPLDHVLLVARPQRASHLLLLLL